MKLNKKRSENEINYRSELEAKLRDLTEMYLFEKKIYEQELDNLKGQLLMAQSTINDIELKLSNHDNESEVNTNNSNNYDEENNEQNFKPMLINVSQENAFLIKRINELEEKTNEHLKSVNRFELLKELNSPSKTTANSSSLNLKSWPIQFNQTQNNEVFDQSKRTTNQMPPSPLTNSEKVLLSSFSFCCFLPRLHL